MLRSDRQVWRRLAAAGSLGALLLTLGCSSLANLKKPPPAPAPSVEIQNAGQLAGYLEMLQRLVQGSPTEQAEVLAGARAGYEQQHQGPAQLRYALALAAPSHPARDPALAQKLLRETLAAPERLTSVERALALLELQRVDTELRLQTENQRLIAAVERERNRDRGGPGAATSAAATRRLQAEIDENARLKRALDEARAKLDAIANIETNITDRKPPVEGR
ncbi:MAG TPA: hypothetical protein VGO41_04470 [Steroidobacteraceae bacterium]|jgi:hypothetical protein|nr:hypothetical protein [Steroidobacteraceae bacterium]